jgi:hypothetical protein
MKYIIFIFMKCFVLIITDKSAEITKPNVSFPTGPDINYDDCTVGTLRKMVTQAVMLDGMDNVSTKYKIRQRYKI